MIEPSDEMLRLWLLHRQPRPDAEMLEQHLLQDPTFAPRLRAVETDLLDDFARNRLSDEDRDAVANHLLTTPGDRARLRIAFALARIGEKSVQSPRFVHADRHAPAASPTHWSQRNRRMVAGGLLASACAALIAVVGLRHHGGIERPTLPDAVTTVTLLIDQQRGTQREDIRIPHGASTIRLQVEVDSASAQTRYTLSIADGARTVFSAHDLVPREAVPYHFVEVTFAAQTLSDGAYEVRVMAQRTPANESIWSIRGRDE